MRKNRRAKTYYFHNSTIDKLAWLVENGKQQALAEAQAAQLSEAETERRLRNVNDTSITEAAIEEKYNRAQ